MVNIEILDKIEKKDKTEKVLGSSTAMFMCPNCGTIEQNDVIFVCNVCSHDEIMLKEGIYICPQCLTPGENFVCSKCENKNVTITFKNLDG